MITSSGRQRPFPALVIVSLLMLFCLFPGQGWTAHLLPRLSGLATIDPSLVILHTPMRLVVTIDLILVPLLFFFLYTIAILIYSIRQHLPAGRAVAHRLGALFSGSFFVVVCITIGGLISWVLAEQLPATIRDAISAIGVNADIHLPFLGYQTNSLHGDILPLLGLLIGMAIFIGKIRRNPLSRRSTPLTREQRMTPYQRMLQERRMAASTPLVLRDEPMTTPAFRGDETAAPSPRFYSRPVHCHNEPLVTLEPEAVNYRPLG